MTGKIPEQYLDATVTTDTHLTGLAVGYTEYEITHTYDTLINLTDTNGPVSDASGTGVYVVGGLGNDEFLLGSSSGNILQAGAGNDEFIIGADSTDLNGNVLIGGGGFNDVVFKGAGQTADLTAVTYGIASKGIDAVVGGATLGGETVDLTLGQVASTNLNGGVSKDAGRAFAALIGTDGTVNLTVPAQATLVGVLNAAGAGFDGSGNALDATDTSTLLTEVTSIGNVAGTLARTYTNSTKTAVQTAALENMDAYVFLSGGVYYTVWTDGTITTTDNLGNVNTLTQPTAATSLLPNGLGVVQIYDTDKSHVKATISTNANTGATQLTLGAGTTGSYDSITVGAVSGTVIQGASNAGGGADFNLNASLGGNTVIGTVANDVFDIGTSGALSDVLQGGGGFNMVTAEGSGDIDLTANNANTGVAASKIEAVVGSAATNPTLTVEVDLSTLAPIKGAAVFEALLGPTGSTLTVSASKNAWTLVDTFAPSSALPTGATALTDADLLDTTYGASKTYNAENSMTGYLFEKLNAKNQVLESVTVYTDATLLTQSIASFSPPPASASAASAAPATSHSLLATPAHG